MKNLFYISSVLSSVFFDPTKLEGKWYQLATNDPTIPKYCNNQKLEWKLMSNKKDYEVLFESMCFDKININVYIHGSIENGALYENFKPLLKIYRTDIVNIKKNKNEYDIVELIAKYNIFNIYKKDIYQLWSRKKLPEEEIKNYIKNAEIKYKMNDIRIIK